MADSDEVCGCNGVNKGTICKAIKDKGLFTLDEVRKHTKASAQLRLLHRPGRAAADVHRRRRLLAPPTKKAMCGCTDASHQDARDAIRERAPADASTTSTSIWTGARPTAAPAAARRSTTTCSAPGPRRPRTTRRAATSTSAATPTSRRTAPTRVIPRMWGGETTADELRRIADAVDKYKIPHRQGHRRPAHRPAGREEGRPARGLEGHRHALRPCLRQGAAHGEDLRRQRVVPLRHAGQHADGQGPGARAVAHVRAAQGQARGVAAARATAPRPASRTWA